MRRPLLALTTGDPAGIGPEIVRALLADYPALRARMRIVAIGPSSERPDGLGDFDPRADVSWRTTGDAAVDWTPGVASAAGGRAALAALREGATLASSGQVDALVTAPVSKEALHAAGERCEGQTELLGRWAGAPVEMLAIAGELRVLLLTRHMPLRAALDAIREDAIVAHLGLLDRGLRELGFDRPRLALAGLNPHAGEGGILGTEELDILRPALDAARKSGLDVTGPEPPDTVFLRASQGAFDAVLALYHDQAFIPVKLAAPMAGLTVLLGLPYLRVSPAHGTAFDIVGRGVADPSNLRLALEQAAEWARARTQPGVSSSPARA